MKQFTRADRVGGKIHKVLSDLLSRGVSDPRLENATISGVKMSRDLRIAKVYFTIFGGHQKSENAAEGFKSAKGWVKRELAGKLGLRYMPDLKFFYDESFDYGSRIDRVLKSIKADNEPDHQSTE